MTREIKEPGRGEIGGLVFVGCLVLGLAAGFLMNSVFFGLLGGLGVGFIALALTSLAEKADGRDRDIGGMLFVGCLILGFAVGFLTENIVVGLFGGLGIGFVAMALARYATGER